MLKGPNLEEDKKILTGFYDTVKGGDFRPIITQAQSGNQPIVADLIL